MKGKTGKSKASEGMKSMSLKERQRRFPQLTKEELEKDDEYLFDTWVEHEMEAEIETVIGDCRKRYTKTLEAYNKEYNTDTTIDKMALRNLRLVQDYIIEAMVGA